MYKRGCVYYAQNGFTSHAKDAWALVADCFDCVTHSPRIVITHNSVVAKYTTQTPSPSVWVDCATNFNVIT